MLTGRLIKLRDAGDRDLPALLELRNDVELQEAAMAVVRGSSLEDVREWLARRAGEDDTIFFVVADTKTDNACGYVQLREIDAVPGTGVLGIILCRKVQGRGYAKEAMMLLEQHAVRSSSVRRVTLSVLADNSRAVAFYDKVGYRRVATHRDRCPRSDALRDVLVMEKDL